MNKRLLLIIALQIALLLAIVGKYQYVALTGQSVLLKTAPVDPVDPFYGDYVVLNYEIARIDGTSVPHDVTQEDQDHQVYVILQQKTNPWHEAVGVYRSLPKLAQGQIALKGTLRYVDSEGTREISIGYGIERYYVPENTGHEIEDRRDQLTMVEVKVSGSGDAVIARLVYK
ncbi:hypothetical protein EDM56_19540 [Brevibacillus fluminis]|uniref:GDYXXLXY domain-containing protein n=1 Tax=Brevibacillus fluminis TaxID=511487 RepID=A0A3M8DAW1_9BACL|nr:GDYXXLXY domain-containing protein [Brevibacillus fluminis]RNB85103.1 hypothetical protein EDM56_19540 [Brevibacillus fluminis]